MFREIRRKNNRISLDETTMLLNTARYGILAVNGDDGYPYAVPINYLYDEKNNMIYFHGARAGHKAESIKNDDKVCFTVVSNEEIKDEAWAPYAKSAVIFGRCHVIDDRTETIRLCRLFAGKYYPSDELIEKEVTAAENCVYMYAINIEHIDGKMIQEK